MPRGYDTVSNFDKRQQDLYNRYSRGAGQGPSGYYDNPTYQAGNNLIQQYLDDSPEAYAKFEAPFQRQFQQQVGGLAERFGGLGATSSSGFQQALGGAATDLSERLASLRGNIQNQMLPQALQYAGAPLEHGRSILNMETQSFMPKQPSWWQSALTGLTGGLTGGFGTSFGKGLAGKIFG